MTQSPSLALQLGSAARLRDVPDDSVQLVVTSPPYFPQSLEATLARPRQAQVDFDRVERTVLGFALTLRPAFEEIRRVLVPDGVLVLQTKDLRFGPWLIALADAHASLALQAGLHLIGKVCWAPKPVSLRRRPSFARAPRVGNYRPLEVEWFMVFGNEVPPRQRSRLPRTAELARWVDPLWRTMADRRKQRHPYGSPPAVVRRWIQLYSEPGDVVLDPFAGFGTTVTEATRLGRQGVGYEIDPAIIRAAGAELRT